MSDVLSAKERCDYCTAKAMVRVQLETGILDFCGHHYKQFENPLREQGARVVISEMDSNGTQGGGEREKALV